MRLAAAGLALVAIAVPARSQDNGASVQPSTGYDPANAPTLNVPQSPAGAPQGRRPIMSLLDDAGLAKPLDAARIDVYGHVEGSYTWNFDNPKSRQNPFRLFDFEDNKALLNQLDLTIERRVNYRNAHDWDFGFLVEQIYGADAGLIHANGLFDYYDSPRKPENQYDLTQAYFDIVVPVGTGLRVRVGKFVNLVGYEAINPTVGGVIDFYSRSFVFASGYPFTHTGVLGTYDLTPDVTVTAGVTRGDDQAVRDDNGAVSFLGSVNWVINKQLALYVSNSTGPEQPKDESHYRTTWDATLYYTPTDRLDTALTGYFLYDAAGVPGGGSGELYDVAALAAYRLNDYLTVKGRFEWMYDQSGVRIPKGTDLYGVTAGLTITPLPHDHWGSNLKIRPELRYDASNDPVFNGKDHQFTFGIDAVYRL
jgi:hypothetical protein